MERAITAFRSRPEDCIIDEHHGFAPLRDGWEVLVVPLLDATEQLEDGTHICAQLTYADAERALARHGLVMLDPDDVGHLHRLAADGKAIELPAFTGTPTAEVSLAARKVSDTANRKSLTASGWMPGTPVANFGKGWVAGAPAGRAWLMGWWVPSLAAYSPTRKGPGFIQPRPAPGSRGAHAAGDHADDGTNVWGKRRVSGAAPPPRDDGATNTAPLPTMRRGDGYGTRKHLIEFVREVQKLVGATADGLFGPGTERAVRVWQSARKLVPDGIFGPKSWAAATMSPTDEREPPPKKSGDLRSPACLAAIRDSNARWPGRSRVSDGILGDARHSSKSDHSRGDAYDLTSDPDAGCSGNVIAEMSQRDKRTKYIIWNRRIWSAQRAAEGWRSYSGSNPHTKHCHVSIITALRDDASPWPWAT